MERQIDCIILSKTQWQKGEEILFSFDVILKKEEGEILNDYWPPTLVWLSPRCRRMITALWTATWFLVKHRRWEEQTECSRPPPRASWSFRVHDYCYGCAMSKLMSLLICILLLGENKVKSEAMLLLGDILKSKALIQGVSVSSVPFFTLYCRNHRSGSLLRHPRCPRFGSSKIKGSLMTLGNRDCFGQICVYFHFPLAYFILKFYCDVLVGEK